MTGFSASPDLLEGRPLRVQGVDLVLVHSTLFAGGLHVALRLGEVDVLLSFHAGDRRPEAFVSQDGINVTYVRHPGGTNLDSRQQGALRDLAIRFLGRFGPDILREGRDHVPGEPVGDPVRNLRPPAGFRLQTRSLGPGCADLEFQSDEGDRALRFRLFPRPSGAPGMMLWSVSLEEAGGWDEEERDTFRTLLLDLVLAVQLTFVAGARWAGTGGYGSGPGGPASSVRIDLAASGPDFGRALDLLSQGPLPEEVHVEVPTRCALKCQFCPISIAPSRIPDGLDQPAQAGAMLRRVEDVSRVLLEHYRRGSSFGVLLYGHDVLAFPDAVELVRRVEECHPALISIVTPGTRLADPDFVGRLSSASPRLSTTLTLAGHDAALHDRIVGREGAFAELMAAIRNCRRCGIGVELNAVIVSANQHELARMIDVAGGAGCRLNLMLFNTEPQFSRDLVLRNMPSLGDLRRALAGVDDRSRASVNLVVDIPWCVLPEWAVGIARWPTHTLADRPASPAPGCSRCRRYRDPCGGPSDWYLRIRGEQDLEPVG